MSAVLWKAEPDERDYPTAASYLSLLASNSQVGDLVARLKTGNIEYYTGIVNPAAVGHPLFA
jgi:hypothetical protein